MRPPVPGETSCHGRIAKMALTQELNANYYVLSAQGNDRIIDSAVFYPANYGFIP